MIDVERLALKYRACGGVYEAVETQFGFVLALFEDEPTVARQFWDANIKELTGEELRLFLVALVSKPFLEPRLGAAFPFSAEMQRKGDSRHQIDGIPAVAGEPAIRKGS